MGRDNVDDVLIMELDVRRVQARYHSGMKWLRHVGGVDKKL